MSSPTQDKATAVERFGIEHIPEDQRHGSPGRVFTLWFAANLTIADYVIGVFVVLANGLTVLQAIPVLILGNVLGGLAVGLSAAMGPKLGYPQMFSSRGSFGRKGNYIPGALNWISTIGWFSVNTILGSQALQVIVPGFNFYAGAALLVALQVFIAIYGHDFIHLFEKWMSVILGVLWLGIFILAVLHIQDALSFVPPGGSQSAPLVGEVAAVLATSFSYIVSWSPYASDYSRYLPVASSRKRTVLFALAGGALASFAVEVIGSLVAALTQSSNYFSALYSYAGSFGVFAIIAVILGAIAANALNIYTNSLSALVLDVKAKRWITVVVGGIVGLSLAVAGGASFATFYQDFLFMLDYWITPWFGIILVDFFVLNRTTVETLNRARAWDITTLGIYGLSILISAPFMVPPVSVPAPFGIFVGSLSGFFDGADFSYFISFGIAAVLYYVYRKLAKD